jgi:Icc-related predicted phosphoesterase
MRTRQRLKSLWLSVVALCQLGGCAARPVPTFSGTPFYAPAGHFSVIGDLQATMPEEETWLQREDNDLERWLLLPEIARHNPAFVVMVGDLVSWGASGIEWQDFDERTDTLRRMGIPVFAVPGNHDYFGGDDLRQYFARLPHIQGQKWYERRYGGLGMIFLDSNAGPLSKGEWLDQKHWYEAALGRFDADPSVLGVLVFLHHAPLTNSSIVDDDPNVLSTFVPAFRSARKTMAMVSGHAHGYERFQRGKKAFIVTAGGGGPRGPLLMGDKRRHPDDLFPGPQLRNFNYVDFSLEAHGLHAEVVGLPKDWQRFCHMESFDLSWPAGAIAEGPLIDTNPVAQRSTLPDCYPRVGRRRAVAG